MMAPRIRGVVILTSEGYNRNSRLSEVKLKCSGGVCLHHKNSGIGDLIRCHAVKLTCYNFVVVNSNSVVSSAWLSQENVV